MYDYASIDMEYDGLPKDLEIHKHYSTYGISSLIPRHSTKRLSKLRSWNSPRWHTRLSDPRPLGKAVRLFYAIGFLRMLSCVLELDLSHPLH